MPVTVAPVSNFVVQATGGLSHNSTVCGTDRHKKGAEMVANLPPL
jgi:hypothetical protein